ncbi:Fic family protein [Leptotrichia wadei]|uniref:Fic family protein n=1 Tax=Leptotrichia wadei TaxID=157687 RepID=UPI0028E3A493|nr:Fic family protein [Leptotrichia wadei]
MEDKYKMTLEENIFVAKRNIVDSIWKSANLEGIAVTYPQTETIFQGLGIQNMKVKDINAIVNLKHSWEFILENIKYPIDLNYICKINQLIGEANVNPFPGLSMGGTDWKPEIPDKEKVNDSLNKILESENSATEKAINLMLYLMRSQLFYDGNKRTSMMAANQVMIQNGAGIISVPIKYQEEFLELLVKFYETNNMDEIKELIYNHCIDGINFKRE